MKKNVAKNSIVIMGPDLAAILGKVSIDLGLVQDLEAIPSIEAGKPKETEREEKKNPKVHQLLEVLRKIKKRKNIRIPEVEESALNTVIRGPRAKVKAEAKVRARAKAKARVRATKAKAKARVEARAKAKARARAKAEVEAEVKAKVAPKVKVKANQKNQKKKTKMPIIIRMRVAAKLRKKKAKTIKG